MASKFSEKELDYLLEEYKILWDYYKKTLDQRSEWLKSISLFIGIIAIAISPSFISINDSIIIVLLISTFLIGISISFVYMSESKISRRYLKKIKKIQEILASNTSIYKDILTSDEYNSKNSKATSISIQLSKCFPLYLINSLTAYLALFFAGANLPISIMASSLILILQVTVYAIWLRKEYQ